MIDPILLTLLDNSLKADIKNCLLWFEVKRWSFPSSSDTLEMDRGHLASTLEINRSIGGSTTVEMFNLDHLNIVSPKNTAY